ncbi:MAG: OmpA family protein, partial [Myxococcota bacterium]|nr:OmpA family protein [Myxococcota bacterium]
LTVNTPRVLGHLDFSLALGGTWAFQPLVLRAEAAPPCTGFTKTRTFEVRHLVTPQLTFALGLLRRFQVGFGVPVGIMSGRRQICEPGPDGTEVCGGLDAGPGGRNDLGFFDWGVGDIALHLKAHALTRPRAPLDLGFLLSTSIPVSGFYAEGTWHQAFLGERYPVLRPVVLLERAWGASGRVITALNVGALVRFTEETFTDNGQPGVIAEGRIFCYPVDDFRSNNPGPCGTGRSRSLGSQLTYGLAVAIAAVPSRLDLVGEIYGYAGLTGARSSYPVEGVGGVRLYLSPTVSILAGAGGGVYGVAEAGRNTGGSLFRLFGSLMVAPSFGARPPAPVSTPSRDSDQDGIPDGLDRCPLEPEDRDGHDDQDGCPDADNDSDGVPDRVDRCPLQPEDPDGHDDQDGCPDPDTDGDGVLDTADACINQPGPRENQGCPDGDRDRDGQVDRLDQCPDEPGPPPHGCPERKYIVVTRDRIELKHQIHFAKNKAKIYPDSFPLLDEVVEALKHQPQVKVRIEGHTDSRGKPKKNLALSQRRAEAVRSYLVQAGIAADRLTAVGYGAERPIADNSTEAGREKNRRTEFILIRPEMSPAP